MRSSRFLLLTLCIALLCACSKGEEQKKKEIAAPDSSPIELDNSKKKNPKLSPETQRVLEQDEAMRKRRLANPKISDKEYFGREIPTPKW